MWRAGRGAGLGGSRGLSWGSWGPLGPLGASGWGRLGASGLSGGLWGSLGGPPGPPNETPERRLWGVSGGLWGPLGASGGRWGHDRYPRAPRGTKKQTNKQTNNKQRDPQTNEQTNKQAHKQTNKQAQRSHSTPNLTRFPFPALPGSNRRRFGILFLDFARFPRFLKRPFRSRGATCFEKNRPSVCLFFFSIFLEGRLAS